ncbi:MAG: hypothetical protein WAO98_05365 [Alphaproteobacteria bacterium]
MRHVITVIAVLMISLLTTAAFADHVNGYTRSNGTYVQPYERSHSDNTVTNNYSYQGNTNPYTGSTGTNRYEHDQTSPYFTGPDSNGRIGHSNSYGYSDLDDNQ